jgi:RNA polymerase sigma-70 factor (ECF subfamily)
MIRFSRIPELSLPVWPDRSAEAVGLSENRSHAEEKNRIACIRAGEVDPFAEVFTTYHERLCFYAESYVRSPETAKEIVSDVFLWIWEHRREWKVHGSPTSYLYGAVRHRAMDHLKHQRRAGRAHARVLQAEYSPGMREPVALPEEELHGLELARLVERTINRLPERSREAFLLQRQHSLSYSEIATTMGISVSTVEKHMIRALAALREGLASWMRMR